MSLNKGQKIDITNNCFNLDASSISNNNLSHSIFVLDKNKKLIQDEFMVFYGNTHSPNQAIFLDDNEVYHIDLNLLPSEADRVSFTIHTPVSAPEQENLSILPDVSVKFSNNDITFNGKNLLSEKALIVVEFYKYQNNWKASCTLQGFNGGLAKLVEFYGAEVENSSKTNVENKQPITISLSKQRIQNLEKNNKDPIIINLAKKAESFLNNFNLDNHNADVVIVIDFSYSMQQSFHSGMVQKISEQLVAAAALFDDNQSVDVYMFDSRVKYLGELTPDNFKNKINEWVDKYGLGGGTDYAKPIKEVRDKFFNSNNEKLGFFTKKSHLLSEIPAERDKPVYVLFLTDGDATDKSQTTRLIKEVSKLPIFWQFVGIGSLYNDFKYLEKLDDLSDRFIDNADFFKIDSNDTVDENFLFSNMFKEYPEWIKNAQKMKLLKK